FFDQFAPAIDGVHKLQWTIPGGGAFPPTFRQPIHETGGLLGETDAHQGIEREGSVAKPTVPVVPVADAADLLGQARGQGRDDRSSRLICHQLERECRAQHHLAPTAMVGAMRKPALPVCDRLAEILLRFAGSGTLPYSSALAISRSKA